MLLVRNARMNCIHQNDVNNKVEEIVSPVFRIKHLNTFVNLLKKNISLSIPNINEILLPH